MNAASRAKAILFDPVAEWTKIEEDDDDPAHVLTHYVALLALIPALCGLIGAGLIGVVGPDGETVRAPLFDQLFGAVFGYVMACAIALLLGLVVDLLAPVFGGKKDFDKAFALAVYSFTPVWLAGVFLLLPGLRFLTLAGFYGIYIFATGLPLLMKSPPSHTFRYAAVIAVSALVLTLGVAAAKSALFG